MTFTFTVGDQMMYAAAGGDANDYDGVCRRSLP